MVSEFDVANVLIPGKAHHLGENHVTFIRNRKYSSIKGLLSYEPSRFMHPLYRTGCDQVGCYLLVDLLTHQVYVGSSEEIYDRIAKHKWMIRTNTHDNSKLQELLKSSSLSDFELIVFFTDTREEAYELEQFFVNRYKTIGALINIAHDVRYAMRGVVLSDEHKRKISTSNTGRVMSQEAKRKLSESRKNSPLAQKQLVEILQRKQRPLEVNGVRYASIRAAAIALNRSESALRKAANRSNGEIKYLAEPTSPLVGRVKKGFSS